MSNSDSKEVFSYDVWQWPEFQAFAKRLGVNLEAKTTDLTIWLDFDGLARFTQEILVSEKVEEKRPLLTDEELVRRKEAVYRSRVGGGGGPNATPPSPEKLL